MKEHLSKLMRHTAHKAGWQEEPGKLQWWFENHINAMQHPKPRSLEQALVLMLKGWLIYADEHRRRYESKIGDDMVLGPAWAAIGHGMRDLLNGVLDRLDGGMLDGIIVDTLTEEGLFDD